MKSPIYFIYYNHIYVIWRYPVGDITPWRIAMSICLSEISLSIWIRIVSVSCFQFSSPFLSLCLSLLLLLSSIPAFANVRQLPWLPLIQPSHSYFTCSCYIGSAFVYVLFALHSNGFGIHRSPGSAPRCQGFRTLQRRTRTGCYSLRRLFAFQWLAFVSLSFSLSLSLSLSLSRFLYLCECVCVCLSLSGISPSVPIVPLQSCVANTNENSTNGNSSYRFANSTPHSRYSWIVECSTH